MDPIALIDSSGNEIGQYWPDTGAYSVYADADPEVAAYIAEEWKAVEYMNPQATAFEADYPVGAPISPWGGQTITVKTVAGNAPPTNPLQAGIELAKIATSVVRVASGAMYQYQKNAQGTYTPVRYVPGVTPLGGGSNSMLMWAALAALAIVALS